MGLLNRDKYKIGGTVIEKNDITPERKLTTAILENIEEEVPYLLIICECESDAEERKYKSDVYNIVRYLNHQAKIFDQRRADESRQGA